MDYRFWPKATVLCAVVAITASSCAFLGANEKKTEAGADLSVISADIPSSASIHLLTRGDLDSDGDSDALVVLDGQSDARARNAPRTLLVFLRNPRGVLEKAATSPRAILCQACGGAMGDPLQGIDVIPGSFTLRFEGGSRELWQRHYTFVYLPDARTWVLYAVSNKIVDRIEEGSEPIHTDAPAPEAVFIEKFDPNEFMEETISGL